MDVSVMEKIKIAFITGLLGMGGAERQLFHLINGLDPKKYDILIISLGDSTDEFWAGEIKKIGIEVVNVPRTNRLLRAWRIRKIIQTWKAEIIQGFHFYVNGYGVLASWPYGAPVIGGMRNLPNERHINKVPKLWRDLCICRVTKLACNSRAAVEMLRIKYPKLKNLLYIPNGVHYASDGALDEIRHVAEKKMEKKEKTIIIGYVGQLIPRKNISFLIKSTRELAPLFPNLRLVIIGEGWYRTELEKEVAEYGLENIVTFMGACDNAINLMTAFDIMCLASIYEGMPNVVMEASSVGVPCVASNIAGTPDLIDDGETGFLFEPDNNDVLTSKLKRLLEDKQLREDMGTAARKRMGKTFSIENMVASYRKLYDELLKRPRND